jgi:hypothetical protein
MVEGKVSILSFLGKKRERNCSKARAVMAI